MTNLKDTKATVLEQYKQAKKEYLSMPTTENWAKFCDAKRNCMLLGVRI